MNIVALDIETTGLDPSVHEVLAVGLYSADGATDFGGKPEDVLLSNLEQALRESDDRTCLVTWNGEEFDLPFLASRFKQHNIATKLELTPRHEEGKYGGPLFKARWGHLEHLDVARLYESVAKGLAIPWGLKSVSRRILGLNPIEVDRNGAAIAKMAQEDLSAYVLSDARMTYLLAWRILSASDLTPPRVPLSCR